MNQWKIKEAPWRDKPCFRWADGNQQLQLQYPGPAETQQTWPNRNQEGPQHNSNWSRKNQEGPNNWSYRNQGEEHNWSNRNQSNQGNSYVPPHQRNATGNNLNFQHNHQGNQGSGNQFNNNQGGQGNYRQGQGSGMNHNQGQNSNQTSYMPQRSLDDMLHNLTSSQQHMQNNMQANNDVVHKLQNAQQEHKAAMEMLSKQMSQLTTLLNEIRRNEGRIPASVKPPDRANISQITLRSGRGYDGPMMKNDERMSSTVNKEDERFVPNQVSTVIGNTRIEDDLRKGDFEKPLPRMTEPFFLDPEPEVESEELRREIGEPSARGSA